jgi:hypothetical protein
MNDMNAIQFLMTRLDIPEFVSELDEFSENYRVIAGIMDKYVEHKQKLNLSGIGSKRQFTVAEMREKIKQRGEEIEKAACASGGVDTVAGRGHIHKWHETSAKERICYMCGETEKKDVRKSSEGQP